MCGIIGVLGQHQAAPLLVEGLKRLEYRGYDSAGIATICDGVLERRRAVGKLVNLSDRLVHEPLAGTSGIGHTRWATHGAPNEKNAHPHRSGPVAVVHNGIIENFRDLRAELETYQIQHHTDTDTETVTLLTELHMSQGKSPVDAAFATLDKLEGAFALAFLFEGQQDLMVIARKGSPLAIGHGEDEIFIGSDAIALAPLTNRITYLEEGDRAVLTRAGAKIFDETGETVTRAEQISSIDASQVDKGGHKHFMAKEIAEQPEVLANCIGRYVTSDGTIAQTDIDWQKIERITLVACGTASYAALTAKYWFEQIARLPVEFDVASEFRYREPPVQPGTLAIFVSQSGETADTLAALRYMKGKAETIAAVVNVPTSSIARESDRVFELYAGPEIGVASTKAFTCQLTVLLSLVLSAAENRQLLSGETLERAVSNLRALPRFVNEALQQEAQMEQIAVAVSQYEDILFLGRGAMYPLAREAALKLMEISYIHAEAYASGELKHGPIALIDEHMPVIVLAPRDPLFDKTVSNMQEVMARKGKIVLLSDEKGLAESSEGVWGSVEMPSCPDMLAPIVYAIPAQLIAYHTAIAKGTDVDQPRNLAKSVTVE